MKAAIYARYSTDKQNAASIADQFRVCRDYAHKQGWTVVAEHSDDGFSGDALGNRPNALRVIADGKDRKYDVLLVMELWRLARSEDLPPLLKRLKFCGLRIIGVQDSYDSVQAHSRMQAGMASIMGGEFIEMVKRRTHSALEMRAKDKRATGGRAYGYIPASKSESGAMEVNQAEAPIIREIFQRYADGESCFAIAADLNARRVPSPGSSWNRTTRRAKGWMGSAIRSMLRNPIYKGDVIWNASEWRKDPDSGKRVRVKRPASEWIRYRNDDLQIVAPESWTRAQRETRKVLDDHSRGRMKTPYLLSGLLRCDACGSNFIMADDRAYACSSHVNGRACTNTIRIRRDHAETELIGPIHNGLLLPDRVQRMAGELQRRFNERMAARQLRSEQAPKELQDIEARIARLRERLQRGDPDMTGDEIQAAIDRAESKRDELASAQPEAKQQAKILTLLPKAAELYRRQIVAGLNGHAREALKARALLRDLFGGKIRMIPGQDGSLWAEYGLHVRALLRSADGNGSGGRI